MLNPVCSLQDIHSDPDPILRCSALAGMLCDKKRREQNEQEGERKGRSNNKSLKRQLNHKRCWRIGKNGERKKKKKGKKEKRRKEMVK